MDKLTKELIAQVAVANDIEPAALWAVKSIESGYGDGFYSDGRPIILFEGHIFYMFLLKRYNTTEIQKLMKQHPTIIYQNWTKKFYKGGIKECDRLQEAAEIDREAALQSTSWGIFQIMGFNYKQCGCRTIQAFVNKMYKSNESQLQLAVNFLKSNGYLELLAKHDWAGFAKKYNGPGYKKNRYDEKLRKAYEEYSGS